MPAWKSGLAAVLALLAISGSAFAQAPKIASAGASASYPATQTPGNLSAYYGMTPNFANYGLSGSYPSYGGYGYSAYGPGAQFGAHFPASPASKPAPAASKPATPINRKQTGKSGSFGYSTTRGTPIPRKGL